MSAPSLRNSRERTSRHPVDGDWAPCSDVGEDGTASFLSMDLDDDPRLEFFS